MKLKKYDYKCSKCNSAISVDNIVNFIIEDQYGLESNIYLSGVPGEYNYAIEGGGELIHGMEYNFKCPCCRESMKSEKHPKFIEVNLEVGNQTTLNIYFSPIFGEMKTLVFMNDNFFTNSYHFPTWQERETESKIA